MVDFILNIKYEGALDIVLYLVFFLSVLYSLYYVIMHTEKIIRTLSPKAFKNRIEVINLFTERKRSRMPVEEIDVRWFIQEALKTHSKEVKGVKRVYLMERPIDVPKNLLARYLPNTKEGSIIQLYPMKYDTENDNFYLQLEEKSKTGYTDREAKETLLYSLGQEFGRHHLYKTAKIIEGKNAEIYTERFAAGLKIVDDYLRSGSLYSKESKIKPVNEVGKDEFRN